MDLFETILASHEALSGLGDLSRTVVVALDLSPIEGGRDPERLGVTVIQVFVS